MENQKKDSEYIFEIMKLLDNLEFDYATYLLRKTLNTISSYSKITIPQEQNMKD